MSLYTDLVEAGVKVDNHYSDLYFPRTPQTLEILAKHPLQKSNASTFRSATDGVITVDVPFAFDPYWERRT